MSYIKNICFSAMVCLLLAAFFAQITLADDLHDDLLGYMSLEENGRRVYVVGRKSISGVYYPTDDKDYDKAEVTRVDRYRVKGRLGKGLRFFSKDRSYLQIPQFKLSQPTSKLVISLFVKTNRSGMSSLVSCKTDGSKSGFSLFSRLNCLHFQYGDGQKSYSLRSEQASISDGKWHLVKVIFDKGKVKFFVDNVAYGELQTEGKIIAPGRVPFTVGSYPVPGRGRKIYSFNGTIDEVIIAQSDAAVDKVLKDAAKQAGESAKDILTEQIIAATCEPVNGNEVHFGQPTFHSFFGRPVPLSFLFKGNKEKVKSASLVLYVPESVVCREAFSSNHNLVDQVVTMKKTNVLRDGKQYSRYETQDFDILRDLVKSFSVTITVALDNQDPTKDSAKVYWAIKSNGAEGQAKSFTLKYLKPLPDEPKPGRFEIMNYFLADDMAFHNPALQAEVAKLYLSSGMRGKGRFYDGDTRRVKLDNKLKEKGFTLYNISLWHGPFSKKSEGMTSQAIDVSGRLMKYPCPTAVLNDPEFKDAYRKKVAKKLSVSGDNEWVAFDFEPWGFPRTACFCDKTINAFKKQYSIKEKLSSKIILSKYKRQWTEFWCQTTANITKMWAQAVHAANPTLKITEYTYIFDYDNPKLWERFYAIPKDPRLVAPYVDQYMLSIYHIHGRKLFDSLDKNIRALKKPVCPIILLSRDNELTGGFTAPEDNLSPQLVYQRAIMAASLGCQRFALYPGKWIDGKHHLALGQASRLVWKHENFFFNGKRCDKKIKVTPATQSNTRDDYASVVWEKDGEFLLVLFNFTDKPMPLIADLGNMASGKGKIIDNKGVSYERLEKLNFSVEPHGVLMVTIAK